jgi:hypothetical protein
MRNGMNDVRGQQKREREFYRREELRRKTKTNSLSPLAWRRDGDDWILLAGRRRLGRVVPDSKYPGMWRSVKPGGQLSDIANLSWAKNAVLIAAERELEWDRRAITSSKSQQRAPVFESRSSPMRFSASEAST